MKYRNRFIAIILLIMMVFNIVRYQLPQIEYNLFKGYIAKNLCVKKEIKGNCCQGKCFLKKQRMLAEENTNGNTTNTNNKKTQIVEVNEFVIFHTSILNNIKITKLLFFKSETFFISRFVSDIFIPPQQLS